jgi:hypothetical protein
MNGTEIELLLSLIEDRTKSTRDDILRYVIANKDRIVQELAAKGEAEIPGFGGEKILLRKAAKMHADLVFDLALGRQSA